MVGCRDGSRLREFSPHVSPQGSFRLGTVIRPLAADAVYDLDNVTTLMLSKATITQKASRSSTGWRSRTTRPLTACSHRRRRRAGAGGSRTPTR